MKRAGNLFNKITDFDNLRQAESNARKGKLNQPGVKLFDENPDLKLLLLQESMMNNGFRTSMYETFPIYEPKERIISKLPYYPDRIVHHAIMNVLKPYFHTWFTADTYANIEGRGIHPAVKAIYSKLQCNPSGTFYCLQLDIKKFYPNIPHDILKCKVRRKVKDRDLLLMIDEIIDSADGLPIGNYLSQYLANFYLSDFDHWIKEVIRVKYYFRYADDMIILAANKKELHLILNEVRAYLKERLKLELKSNFQIYPVHKRGIRTLGYVIYHTHILLSKKIKKNFAKAARKKNPNRASIQAYKGWASHANSKNLIKKLLPNEK